MFLKTSKNKKTHIRTQESELSTNMTPIWGFMMVTFLVVLWIYYVDMCLIYVNNVFTNIHKIDLEFFGKNWKNFCVFSSWKPYQNSQNTILQYINTLFKALKLIIFINIMKRRLPTLDPEILKDFDNISDD